MKIKKRVLMLLCVLVCLVSTVSAYTHVTKEKLIYEIQDAVLDEKGISIRGWGFIGESQHFNSTQDFSGSFAIQNGKHTLEYPLTFQRKNMTDLMKMGNPRRCGDTEYNKLARECYYDYSMVGWSVFIPITDLMDDSRYTSELRMKAFKSGQEYRTPVIFTSPFQVIEDKPRTRVVSLNSGIQNTKVTVNHDFVMVRKNPAKSSSVYYSNKSCSTEFGAVQYFIKYTEYLRVKSYQQIDAITWYQIGTEEIGCYGGKASVVEGDNLAWIPSTYVDYNGTIATIDVKNTYTKPIIYLENQTIYLGDTSFNPDEYVTAFDAYDGVLVPIRKRTNLNVFKVGRYYVQYTVTNSKKQTTTAMMYVDVIEKKVNTPPIITAYDQTIYENDRYDPMANVSAKDLEDGDITNKIELTTSIDVSKTGEQEQCYYVEDSEGLSNEKCVTITILPKIIPPIYQHNAIRFIGSNHPFYMESVPSKWEDLLSIVINYASASSTIMRGYY